MKKILFNEHYGLRSAVINGYKNMTRRTTTAFKYPNITDISELGIDEKGKAMVYVTYDTGLQKVVYPHFQIGEVVAISQPYETFMSHHELCVTGLLTSAAAHNSMFVEASMMPHRIRITDIKIERLQDITDEDCLREGIMEGECGMYYYIYGDVPNPTTFKTPREAFASLIDKVSGKGTWESNQFVIAYTFKLVR